MGRGKQSALAVAAPPRRAQLALVFDAEPERGNLGRAARLLSEGDETQRKKLLRRLPAGVLGGERTSFSVTELETYLRCPSGWFAGSVLGARRWAGPSAIRGSLMHGVLGDALKQPAGDRDAVITERLAAAVKAGKLTDSEAREDRERLQRVLRRYTGSSWPFSVHHQELRLRSESVVPGAVITGRADRIDVGPEGALVIDYKNGRTPRRRELDERLSELQRYLYPLLAAEHLETRPLGTVYVSLRHGAHDGSLVRRIDELASEAVDYEWAEDSSAALDRVSAAIARIGQGDWDETGRDCPAWCAHHG